MTRAQDGDRVAYQALLTEVVGLVRSFVRKRLSDSAGVEDIVQDALLSIHRDRHTYDPHRPFGPWMYAIARHRLLDHVAKQRRRDRRELIGEAELELAYSRAGTGVEPAGESMLLQRALALLSDKELEIIRMLKLEGRSVAEISEKTGRSSSSVKVTAHRGYKRLRKLMSRLIDD
jgi:RNA polymerase sigma-70 factor (ECF subfamily)